jgi:hypothetical protein
MIDRSENFSRQERNGKARMCSARVRLLILNLSILVLISLAIAGCSEETIEAVRTVTVAVTVTNHANQLPVYDAIVEILSQNEAPLFPQLRGNTSSEGRVDFVSDSEHLRPSEGYKVLVLYNQQNTIESFLVPEDPNEGNEYYIEVEIVI